MTLLAAIALAAADPACAGGTVTVGKFALHTTVQGEGDVTVVFESGNGNDGTVWEDLATRLAAHGLETLRYDRAGLGQSAPRPGTGYDVTRETDALKGLVDVCASNDRLLVVAHSYGGMIANLLAARDPRVKAILMLDASNPFTETPARTAKLQGLVRPQYDGVREHDPAMADHVIPIMEAWGDTSATVGAAAVPLDLPVYVLVRGVPGSDEDNLEEWQGGMRDYAAQSAYRQMVIAPGMGHKVAKERPDWVEASAMQLVDWIRANAD